MCLACMLWERCSLKLLQHLQRTETAKQRLYMREHLHCTQNYCMFEIFLTKLFSKCLTWGRGSGQFQTPSVLFLCL